MYDDRIMATITAARNAMIKAAKIEFLGFVNKAASIIVITKALIMIIRL